MHDTFSCILALYSKIIFEIFSFDNDDEIRALLLKTISKTKLNKFTFLVYIHILILFVSSKLCCYKY